MGAKYPRGTDVHASFDWLCCALILCLVANAPPRGDLGELGMMKS